MFYRTKCLSQILLSLLNLDIFFSGRLVQDCRPDDVTCSFCGSRWGVICSGRGVTKRP